MRTKIVKYGPFKIVTLITLISIVFSVTIYLPLGYYFLLDYFLNGLIIAIVIPMIIAPLICWYLITLLIKIHYLEVEMRNLATYDSLTQTMSRKTFLTNAKLLCKLDKRDSSTLAVLYIDIDSFKKINDTYGHSAGDEVLKSFGHILNNNKRDSDIVGRLGGEEFAFILPKTNKYGAIQFADNLRDIINKQTIEYNNKTIKYTASIGISILDTTNQVNFEELLKQSDEALYIAKGSGKNCTIMYELNKS